MKKITQSIAAIAIAITLCNCSSIVSDTDYPVSFISGGSPVNLTVKNHLGKVVHRGVTPTTTTLPASSGYFKKARYTVATSKNANQPMQATIDPWYAGNIPLSAAGLIGGLPCLFKPAKPARPLLALI